MMLVARLPGASKRLGLWDLLHGPAFLIPIYIPYSILRYSVMDTNASIGISVPFLKNL